MIETFLILLKEITSPFILFEIICRLDAHPEHLLKEKIVFKIPGDGRILISHLANFPFGPKDLPT